MEKAGWQRHTNIAADRQLRAALQIVTFLTPVKINFGQTPGALQTPHAAIHIPLVALYTPRLPFGFATLVYFVVCSVDPSVNIM